MTTTFIESGTDATQDFSFYASTGGTVASAIDQQFTGPRSIKLSTGAGPTTAVVQTAAGVMADTGSRVSFRVRFDTLGAIQFFSIATSGATPVFGFNLGGASNNNLKIVNSAAAQLGLGATVLAVNTWYRISASYTVTNTTTWRIDVYINGVLELSLNSGSVTVASSVLRLRAGTVANINIWFDDIYADNGASFGDPGEIRVTAKRPFSNGTTNGYTTQIGAGGSGYGSGHAPQVNEQPLSVTNGWSMIGAGSAVTEEYNVEGGSIGDVNISNEEIVDFVGWVYTKALVGETGKIIVDGVSSNIAIPTSAGMLTTFAGKTALPAGTGTDIGEQTDTSLTTVSLYECGIVVAYKLALIGQALL